MKKTQFALAALALVASTAAFANGATVYGTIDVSAAKATDQATAFDGSGNWAGSIFGFTGSEEVDGGLKVTYALEVGLNAGTGRMANGGTGAASAADATSSNVTSTVFNRQANVGLAGDFGSIKAGLQLSPYIASVVGTGVATNNESFYVPFLAMSGSAAATFDVSNGSSTGGFFIPNSVSYTTPNIGGFSATGLMAISRQGVANTATADKDAQKYATYAVSYAAGDVRVGAAYENANSNLLVGGTETKNMALTGAYHMGQARLAVAYIDAKNVAANTSFRTYSIGGAFDATDKIELSANYAATNESTRSTLAVLGAQYKLSKSTAMYLTAGRGTNGVSPLYSTFGGTTGDTTGYAVGMYKSF